ncbi:probable serine/threonine-protein kinase PBL7 [Cucurbita moschata]|uniref:Probable serine/threonine-protein kinase PBL7 n=1 Tax=Cucurbita moschata TaxID=3662 RepID=A0A6J1HBK2_CUCMO|nr:probable serine/threonine-protein kinase PBL7 [Cucurbita moschata]
MELHNSTPPPPNHHIHTHNALLTSNSFLIIIASIIFIAVLLAVLLLISMLHRLKLARGTAAATAAAQSTTFNPHIAINFDSNPEFKGRGYLYGANSGRISKYRIRGVQVFTYKEMELATDHFNEANVIGNGRFGIVYRGVLGDGAVVAIMMIHRDGKQRERAFRMEVDLLSRLQSPCLVELLGYCADKHHRLLIFEFMHNGTLHHHLHNPDTESQPLDWNTRLTIALDCAKALEFLHEHAVPSVIHRNFKSTNVLLDQDFRAKVSDFGSAKMGSDKINGQISTQVLGTTGYLAPEYASTGKLTTKSDVYSYGVVLLELLTGRVPVNIKRPQGEHVLVSWALPRLTNREKVEKIIDPAIQGKYSKKDLIQVAAIAAMCVQPEADYRPLMTDVVQSLVPLVKNRSAS